MVNKEIQLMLKEVALTQEEIMKSAWARDLAWIDFVELLPKNHTASPKLYDSLFKKWEIEMGESFRKDKKARGL